MSGKERFFGIHFDFHAGNDIEIGARTNEEDIEWYIKEAKPDFIQCDCKGHPGNSSYPTKVGKAADKLVRDNLRIWCNAAKKHKLPIFVHYSGVWDAEYVQAHPQEGAIDEEGKNNGDISLFGHYADELLIPQIKELITEYAIDGVWIDGDCWAVKRDFSENAKPFLRENITKEEHNQIMHDAFLAYVKKYVDELHSFAPDFKITSNWAYTSYIPEKPEIDLDFISGDYPSNDSVHVARYEGRCIAVQNKPWDLMAWGFEWKSWTDKPAIQLMQEAAMVLSLGGGFQVYVTQVKDGSARKSKSTRFRELGQFMHERRINFQKKPLAQVGVFYSAESRYKKSEIFNAAGATDALIGTLNCVLDAQYTADIVLEYQMEKLAQYDIVVFPQWEFISDANKDKLLEYAKNGGNLVVIGAELSSQFGKLLHKDFGEVEHDVEQCIMDEDGGFAMVTGAFIDLKSGEEKLYSDMDMRDKDKAAYRIDEIEKGKIIFVPFNLGDCYFHASSYILNHYLKTIFHGLSRPIIEINKTNIDITMQNNDDGIMVNLINMNQGRHDLKYCVYNEIPAIVDIELFVHKPFSKVTMPFGESFTYESDEHGVKIKIDKLDIHSVICLQ